MGPQMPFSWLTNWKVGGEEVACRKASITLSLCLVGEQAFTVRTVMRVCLGFLFLKWNDYYCTHFRDTVRIKCHMSILSFPFCPRFTVFTLVGIWSSSNPFPFVTGVIRPDLWV